MIKWNSQGMARLHQHERDSFQNEDVLQHRTHSGVESGDLYATDDGHLMLKDNDGHVRVVGEVCGYHHDLFHDNSTATNDDSDVEISVQDESEPEAHTEAQISWLKSKSQSDERMNALENQVSDMSTMLAKIVGMLTAPRPVPPPVDPQG